MKIDASYTYSTTQAAQLLGVHRVTLYRWVKDGLAGVRMANLVFFCPFMKNPIHWVRVPADEAVWCEFEVRIRRAEEMITMLWRD